MFKDWGCPEEDDTYDDDRPCWGWGVDAEEEDDDDVPWWYT